MPDEHVIFQLEYHRPRQHGGALGRIEWRPIGSHQNKGIGPPEFRFREITGSHIHPFDWNWHHEAKRLRQKNLPVAVPIELEINNFRRFLNL
jgi:hypothetical protein